MQFNFINIFIIFIDLRYKYLRWYLTKFPHVAHEKNETPKRLVELPKLLTLVVSRDKD